LTKIYCRFKQATVAYSLGPRGFGLDTVTTGVVIASPVFSVGLVVSEVLLAAVLTEFYIAIPMQLTDMVWFDATSLVQPVTILRNEVLEMPTVL
jgi:hypothetical protein